MAFMESPRRGGGGISATSGGRGAPRAGGGLDAASCCPPVSNVLRVAGAAGRARAGAWLVASALTPTARLPMIEDAMAPAFPFTLTPLCRVVISMPAHQAGDADWEYRVSRAGLILLRAGRADRRGVGRQRTHRRIIGT